MEVFFALLVIIVGYIIGLGAVTIIDLHGFLGRKSIYWTEATIRTHKVTKPLIWIGIFLVIVGGIWWYTLTGNEFFLLLHLFTSGVLVINGCFLSFVVSPYLLKKEKEEKERKLLPASLQVKIVFSFLFSVLFWWSSLILFIFSVSQFRGISLPNPPFFG